MTPHAWRSTTDEPTTWASVLGSIVVLILLLSLALVAAGGWGWFSAFLTSSASGWVQAFGSIGAILGAFALANRQQRAEKIRDAEAARQQRRQRLEICRTILHRASSVFDSAIKTLQKKHAVGLMREEARHALSLIEAIPLFDVPDVLLVHRFGLLTQSLRHFLLGLDQIEQLGDAETVLSYVRDSRAHERECSVTLLHCGALIRACSTEQELGGFDREQEALRTFGAFIDELEARKKT